MSVRDGTSNKFPISQKSDHIHAIRRGKQARVPPKAAIIGGGKACDDLLTFLADGRLARLGMEILGVADPDPNAPGIRRARAMQIFTTPDFSQLFSLPGLNLIIELTGSMEVREKMIQSKPLHVSSIDHLGARLLWDLIQIESERQNLQREAEEAIRRERDWFQGLIDSLPDGIMILNRDRTIEGVNKTFLEERGLPKEDVIGRHCHEVTHGLSEKCRGPDLDCPFDRVMKTKESSSAIHCHVTPEGESRYYEIMCAPIFGDSGEIVQVIEGIRNVTSRIRLEREVKESERKLRQFLDLTHDIICIKDAYGQYLYINPAGAETMGLTPEKVIGRTDFDLFPPRIAAVMAARDAEALGQHTTLSSKERMRTDSRVHQFHTVRFPIPGDAGHPEALCIVARDMTDEVALQEEVRKNEEYLENVLNHSSDMIITTNFEGFIVTFNPAAERLLGYTKEEMLGAHVEKLWKKPEDRRLLMAEVARLGAVNNYPAVLIAKDGTEVDISLSLSQLRDRRGRVLGTVGVSKDVREENRMRQKLLEQERLVAIGQTIAGITHCMKNVLNGLKGGAYILNTGLKRDDPSLVKEGWENVQKGIERIGMLSLDMLTYCRDRTPRLTAVDPLLLLRETVDSVSRAAAREGIDIVVGGEEGPLVAMDPDSMSRALLNLLSNAVDACRDKAYAENEKPLIEARVLRRDGGLTFLVKDNGKGMTEEIKSQLFTRFFSTKGAKGTGLGLCVTHKIVDEHGGRIGVESRPEGGATFSIVLPANASHESTGDTSKQ